MYLIKLLYNFFIKIVQKNTIKIFTFMNVYISKYILGFIIFIEYINYMVLSLFKNLLFLLKYVYIHHRIFFYISFLVIIYFFSYYLLFFIQICYSIY